MKKHTGIKTNTKVNILLIMAGILILLSLIAPYIVPNDPDASNAMAIRQAPDAIYPFGTDSLGRCVFSRVMVASKTSIFSAIALVGISFILGTAIGMLCGYYEGIIDEVFMRAADILLAFPQMVLAIAVAGILGGGMLNAMLAIGITSWTVYARLARAHTMSLKQEAFIAAARLNGCSDFCILRRHIFPNIAGALTVNATTQLGNTMMSIAGLSFLGIGVIPPQAEWGSMINESRAYIQLAPWTVIAPSAAVLLTIMLFNYLGDAVLDLTGSGGERA